MYNENTFFLNEDENWYFGRFTVFTRNYRKTLTGKERYFSYPKISRKRSTGDQIDYTLLSYNNVYSVISPNFFKLLNFTVVFGYLTS